MTEFLKKASWIELFYDLAYVALVAQLTYLSVEHHDSLYDLLNIFVVGYSIFLAWWVTTANRNLQDVETTTDKLLIQLKMVGAFLMSITMPAVFDGDYLGFFLTLALVRFVQIFMMLRLYRIHPEQAPVTYNMVQGLFIAGVLWAFSGFLADPYHFVLAGMALALDILTPLSVGKGNSIRMLNAYHLQERLGLFLMLVIGESMIVVALSNSLALQTVTMPSIVFSGLILMVALWWLYFEHLDECGVGARPQNLFAYLHAHGLLYGSIILLSVAYKLFLTSSPTLPTYHFFIAGFVGLVITLCVIRWALHGWSPWAEPHLYEVGLLGIATIAYGYYSGAYLESAVILSIVLAAAAFVDRRAQAQLPSSAATP